MRLPITPLLVSLSLLPTPTHTLSYAALGDSYAAGDGAGSPRLPPHHSLPFCGRFSLAYPVQLSQNISLLIPPSRFSNLACGGASSSSVLATQVPYVGADTDVVTVTVGGNEVDFFVVLNACVHEWFPGGDCEGELVRAREAVQSDAFLRRYGEMVRGLRARMEGEGKGRVLLTGYARFFNESTVQCDHASFSRRDPERYLTRGLRTRFNAIVGMLNDVIRATAEAHEVEYVDIDELFDGHRFCEEGVKEPSNTNQTWFFNLRYPSRESDDADQQVLPTPIEDYLDMTRAFHPTALGHEAISRKLASMMHDK